jgi:hypothetical protein
MSERLKCAVVDWAVRAWDSKEKSERSRDCVSRSACSLGRPFRRRQDRHGAGFGSRISSAWPVNGHSLRVGLMLGVLVVMYFLIANAMGLTSTAGVVVALAIGAVFGRAVQRFRYPYATRYRKRMDH